MLFILPSWAWTKQEGFGVCAVFWIKLHFSWDNFILGLFITQGWTLPIFGTVRISVLVLFFIAFFSPYHSKIEIPVSNTEHVKIYFSVLKISDLECSVVQSDYFSFLLAFSLWISLRWALGIEGHSRAAGTCWKWGTALSGLHITLAENFNILFSILYESKTVNSDYLDA